MRSLCRAFWISTALLAALGVVVGAEYNPVGRKDLKRTDFVGNEQMEVLTAIIEAKPRRGDSIAHAPRHRSGIRHSGRNDPASGKEPVALPTGADFVFARDVPHAGFKVVGDTSLRLFTVHVVDKGKPLSEIVAR